MAKIEGSAVAVKTGLGIMNSRIELFDMQGNSVMVSATDAEGRFALFGVPVGEYMLQIHSEMHQPSKLPLRVEGADEVLTVLLRTKKITLPKMGLV